MTDSAIHVPLADWIAKVDPALKDELKPFIKIHSDLLTAEEAANPPPPVVSVDSPIAQARAANGTEPLFGPIGDRKLDLIRGESFPGNEEFHEYKFHDETGKSVGELTILPNAEDGSLYVAGINGLAGLYSNSFGPSLMQHIARQLKEFYPEFVDADGKITLTGHRVSGARAAAGVSLSDPITKARVRLGPGWDSVEAGLDDWMNFRKIFEDKFAEQVGGHEPDPYTIHPTPEGDAMYVGHGWNHDTNRMEPKAEPLGQARPLMEFYKDAYAEAGVTPDHPVGAAANAMALVADRLGLNDLRTYFTTHPDSYFKDNGGLYNPFDPAILVRGSNNPIQKLKTVTHETAHAAFHYVINNNPEVRGNIREMMNFVFDKHGMDILKEGKLGRWYGMTDEHEFISEAFSRPEFQAVLSEIEVPKEWLESKGITFTDGIKTVWDWFISTLQDAFGMEKTPENRTLLEAVLKYGEQLEAKAGEGKGGELKFGPKERIEFERQRDQMRESLNDLMIEPKPDGRMAELRVGEKLWHNSVLLTDAIARGTVNIAHLPEFLREPARQLQQAYKDRWENGPLFGPKEDIEAQLSNIRPTVAGLTKPAFENITRALQARHEADVAAAVKRAEKIQKKKQSAEWKAEEKKLAAGVEASINQLPVVIVDKFIGAGELDGRKIRQRIPLREADLTAEQKAILPRHYYSKEGLPVDTVAEMFGYGSGESMMKDFVEYNAGKEGRSPAAHLQKVITDTVKAQMEALHGSLDDNILREAMDQALSESGLNLIAEEWQAAAMTAGVSVIGKEEAKAEALRVFDARTVGTLDYEALNRKMLQHYNNAVNAIGTGDIAKALVLLQKRYATALQAAEVKKFQRETQNKLDKLFKVYGKEFDPLKGEMEAHYSVFIRDILSRIEQKNGMTRSGLAQAIDKSRFADLTDFINTMENENQLSGLELPVPDFILDKNQNKPYEKLTVAQARELHRALAIMHKTGKDINKVLRESRAEDKTQLIKDMRTQMERWFDPIPKDFDKNEGIGTGVAHFFRTSTNMETLFGRFDHRNKDGLFTTTFVYPAFASSNWKAKLERETELKYRDLGPVRDGHRTIDAPFVNPKTGLPLKNFRRDQLNVIISNMGNEYNWRTLCEGWKVDPNKLWKWVEDNSTVEDLERAQKLSKIFGDLKEIADRNYRERYGVAPENVTVRPFVMHGRQWEGWYHPIIADDELTAFANDKKVKEDWGFWPATSNSYMKRRRGNNIVVDLTYNSIPMHISRMIHDIAFRDTVADFANIIKDTRFKDLMVERAGKEWYEEVDSWLTRMAGQSSRVTGAEAFGQRVSNNLRSNVIQTAVGFNPLTAEKHGATAFMYSAEELDPNLLLSVPKILYGMGMVGTDYAWRAVWDLFGNGNKVQDSIIALAKKKSEEVDRRVQNVEETIAGRHALFEPDAWKTRLKNSIRRYGSMMVSFSDLMSTIPLWWFKYQKELAEHGNEGRAVERADAAVRHAHGSMAEVNLPSIAAGNSMFTPWLTSLYGFMGTSLQRRIEIYHDINDAYRLGMKGEIREAASYIPDILSKTAVYIVWTGIIEEAVTGQFTDDRRGLGEKVASATFGMAFNAMLGARDILHDFQYGTETVGLVGTPVHDLVYLGRDIHKIIKDRQLKERDAGKLLQHGLTFFGDMKGYTPKHVGTLARYGLDVFAGYQHPRNIGDVYRGAISGQQKMRIER